VAAEGLPAALRHRRNAGEIVQKKDGTEQGGLTFSIVALTRAGGVPAAAFP
jgi:hypothetical protein